MTNTEKKLNDILTLVADLEITVQEDLNDEGYITFAEGMLLGVKSSITCFKKSFVELSIIDNT